MEISTSFLFSDALGKKLYDKAARAISDYKMSEKLKNGVVIGFSGGADSVFLLHFLLEYRRQNFDFPIIVCHVNHMIRGEEAYRDMLFSQKVADDLQVDFVKCEIDVPALAKNGGKGIEETARNARYLAFCDIICGRNSQMCIAVAHNASDNLETVIFNMSRGAGLKGLKGIPPVRENIIRPLIYLSSEEIRRALIAKNIDFVIDSTNDSIEYSRNYIRKEIVPKFKGLNSSIEDSVSRLAKILEQDNSYIDTVADDFVLKKCSAKILRKDLLSLHPSVLARVIAILASNNGVDSLEYYHITKVCELLKSDNFSISLPGKMKFVCELGECSFKCDQYVSREDIKCSLVWGKNTIKELGISVIVGDCCEDISPNVYNFSIQETVSSDIIERGIFLRDKMDGDAYRFGGMTRKLKKLFNDKKIPPSQRDKIPVICDSEGILWVPGLPLRDGACDKNGVKITVMFEAGREYPIKCF